MTEKYEQMVKGLCNHVYDNSHVFVVNVCLQLMSFMANMSTAKEKIFHKKLTVTSYRSYNHRQSFWSCTMGTFHIFQKEK